jgi:branched-chain amino acid transport system substrate-binding protein
MSGIRSVFVAMIGVLAIAIGGPVRAADPIVVIAAFNITGPENVLDAPSYNGAVVAVEELNNRGGVLGRPIRLVLVDTASNDKTTAAKMTAALAQNPTAVAGLGFSYSTYARNAGQAFQSAGLPFVTSGATAPDLPQQVGDGMFLAAYGDDAQARAMADYAYNQLNLRHIAVWVNEGRIFTRTVGRYFDEAFRALGGTVDRRGYADGKSDFQDYIAFFKAAETKPQAIYAASRPRTAVTLIEQVRTTEIGVPLLSADGWDDHDLFAASKANGFADILFTTHLFVGVETPAMIAFVDAYTQKFGSAPPNAFAPLGFDTVNLIADAIDRAGSADPADIRDALAETRGFEGVVGKIAYAPGKHVPEKAVSVIRIDNGVKSPVWTWEPLSEE